MLKHFDRAFKVSMYSLTEEFIEENIDCRQFPTQYLQSENIIKII